MRGNAARPPAHGGLTSRECEVLQLLAGGRTNMQIAAALRMSPRTVARHVANIYLKIGSHGRATAAAYAVSHGFLEPS